MATTKTSDKSAVTCPCCCGPGFIIVKILAALILPLLLIWSLNTLFLTGIAYTTYTWFAALVIILILSGRAFKRMHFMGGCGCGGQCGCSTMGQKK